MSSKLGDIRRGAKQPWSLITTMLVTVMLVIVLFLVMALRFSRSDDNSVYDFESTWTAQNGTSTYTNVDVSTFLLDHKMERGETITFSTTLPDPLSDHAVLSLETSYYVVTIDIDGQQVYSYGEDIYEAGDYIGSGYHFISLPKFYSGKTLTITFMPGEDDEIESFYPVQIQNSENIFHKFASQRLFVGAIGVFLVVLGIILFVGGLVFVIWMREHPMVLYIGTGSMLLGIWTLGVTKALQLFSDNLQLNSELEYISLYFLPIMIGLMVMENRGETTTRNRILMQFIVFAFIMFDAIALVCHYTNTLHLPRFLTFFHALVVVGGVIIVITSFGTKKRGRDFLIVSIGLGVLSASGAIEVLRYVFMKATAGGEFDYQVSVLPIGMLIFISMFALSYYLRVYEESLERVQQETWRKMAYTDVMTGLHNRASAEEQFTELRKHEHAFTIVSIDLNNLKRTNDDYGHEAGDAFIKQFSQLLQLQFVDDFVPRMGGDEFLIVSRNSSGEIQESCAKLSEKCSKASAHFHFPLEFAYGIASSENENSRNPEEIFRIADGRMYEMKRGMKSARV